MEGGGEGKGNSRIRLLSNCKFREGTPAFYSEHTGLLTFNRLGNVFFRKLA